MEATIINIQQQHYTLFRKLWGKVPPLFYLWKLLSWYYIIARLIVEPQTFLSSETPEMILHNCMVDSEATKMLCYTHYDLKFIDLEQLILFLQEISYLGSTWEKSIIGSNFIFITSKFTYFCEKFGRTMCKSNYYLKRNGIVEPPDKYLKDILKNTTSTNKWHWHKKLTNALGQ